MKAAYYNKFGELDNIEKGELDTPEPGEGEVLVRIKAAGVNPVDAFATQGMLKDAIPSEFPAIPGWDVAGVVEKRGHSARRFNEGDEVYAYARRPVIQHGTFAEYISIPESYLSKRPQKVSMEEAGGIHSEYTPRGWMKTEKELLIFEQHLYLRQPGYGTSYITGKYQVEEAMAEYARKQEAEGVPFQMQDFFDRLNQIGNIPISMGKWELSGMKPSFAQEK